MTTGADWLVQALLAEGVDVLFGNPGSTELPLIDALGREPRLRYVLGLTEPVVMGMADGYAQATGRLAAVNVHVQPGMANAMSGVLNAARARVPLLVTVGQQAVELADRAPFLGGEIVGMAEPVAKAAWEVQTSADLPAEFARAVRTALEPPTGPVVLSLPLDVQADPAPAAHVPGARPVAPPPPAEALDRAAQVLAAAHAPVVLAGDGVWHAGAGAALAALAERLGAPILGEPFAAGVPVPTDHRLWRGPLPGFALEIGRTLAGHDVVLAVGMPVFRVFGTSPGPALSPEAALLHMDVDPVEVGRTHRPRVGLVGDPAAGVDGLLARLGPATPASAARGRAAEARTAELRRRARARVAAEAAGRRITPAAFCRAVAGAVTQRDLIVDEALTTGRQLRAAVGRRMPGAWLAHRGSALGWGLPAAVGAALAKPGRRVMALQGDGSLIFGLPALWTAAHERLPLALVVADNGGYEILRAGLEGLTGRPDDPSWPGLWLRGPSLDLVALTSGFGADAAHVDAPADLPAAMADLWRRAAEGPAVLVVGVEGRTPAVGYPL